jgi:hypothetical protein
MFRDRREKVFGRKARQDAERIRELTAEKAIILDRLNQLKATRIRVSVPTELGIRPVWDVDVESAIMLTNMTRGDQGPKVEGMHVEVISQYSPLLEERQEDADDLQPWD